MKKILTAAFLLTSVILFNFCTQNQPAQSEIQDIIKTVNLTAGVSDTLLVSDMFYSTDYTLSFVKNPLIKIKYLKAKGFLILDANKKFSGITTVDFKLRNKEYSFPVRVKK